MKGVKWRALILIALYTTPAAAVASGFGKIPVLGPGASTWRFVHGRALERPSGAYAYPFYWEQGLTDRLTIAWMPLPFEIRYLLYEDPLQGEWIWAEGLFLGSIYARQSPFRWRPSISAHRRKRLGGIWAFDASLALEVEAGRGTELQFANSSSARVALGWSPVSGLQLWPALTLLLEGSEATARYLGGRPPTDVGAVRLPLSLEAKWAVSSAWELSGALHSYRLGYEPTFSSEVLFVTLAYLR